MIIDSTYKMVYPCLRQSLKRWLQWFFRFDLCDMSWYFVWQLAQTTPYHVFGAIVVLHCVSTRIGLHIRIVIYRFDLIYSFAPNSHMGANVQLQKFNNRKTKLLSNYLAVQ